MVQILTPWGDPNRGMGPREAFLSNYFDLLLYCCVFVFVLPSGEIKNDK